MRCGTRAGWQNDFTFRGAHTHTCISIYEYYTLLSLYTLKSRPPTPCNPLQIVGVLSPSEAAGKRLELGQAAAIKRCLTATRPPGRMGGWKG